MLHSLAQNTIALQSYKQAFDLPIDSETLSLYPSLESGTISLILLIYAYRFYQEMKFQRIVFPISLKI